MEKVLVMSSHIEREMKKLNATNGPEIQSFSLLFREYKSNNDVQHISRFMTTKVVASFSLQPMLKDMFPETGIQSVDDEDIIRLLEIKYCGRPELGIQQVLHLVAMDKSEKYSEVLVQNYFTNFVENRLIYEPILSGASSTEIVDAFIKGIEPEFFQVAVSERRDYTWKFENVFKAFNSAIDDMKIVTKYETIKSNISKSAQKQQSQNIDYKKNTTVPTAAPVNTNYTSAAAAKLKIQKSDRNI
jgi:hypothetical protein